MSFHEAICVSNQESDPILGKFSWIRENTKLLLQKYDERKDKFRDPKMKKKTWAEMVKEFEIKGYNVTEEVLDRKMRNLKQSYKSIKDNNKKKSSTGCGRISWEWFDNMENIFREDKTIHIGATLASMVSFGEKINDVEQRVITSHSSTEIHEYEQIAIASNRSDIEVREDITSDESCVRTSNLDCFTNTSPYLSVNLYVFQWLKDCAEFKFCSYKYNMENEETRQIDPFVPTNSSPENVLNDLSNRKSKKQKNTRARALYDLRKKQLDCEKRRVNAVNELKEAINEHNNIQRERNEILRQLIQSNRNNLINNENEI